MPDPLGDLSFTWPFYLAALLGYLLGSVPFGLVLTRLAGFGDIRKVGSGNIGATNVLRTGSKPLAAAVLVLGKGVATSLGTLLAVAWPIGALACLTWILVALLFRYSSLAALCALALAPVYAWALSEVPVAGTYFADPQRMELAIFIAIIVFVRHHQNIRRLLTGTESKIGQKSKRPVVENGSREPS